MLCIGDSNTQRSSAARIDTYCDLSRHDTYNAARNGSATEAWSNSNLFELSVADQPFEVCSIMLGTNDAFVGISAYQYIANIKTIVGKCRQHGILFVVLHTPLSNLSGTLDDRIVAYGRELKMYAKSSPLIRIGQDMFELQRQGFFQDWTDNLHIGIRDHINLVSRTDKDFDFD